MYESWWLSKKYSISLEEYNFLFDKQLGQCAICQSILTKPHVDHDRQTGIVTGLLCRPCNQGIGFLIENIQILTNAIIYLNK